MKHLLCSIKDRALDAFMPIFQVRAEPQAIRAVSDAVNNPQEQMHQHPDDYDLYAVGQFDDNTGLIERLEQPRVIARCKDLIKGA